MNKTQIESQDLNELESVSHVRYGKEVSFAKRPIPELQD